MSDKKNTDNDGVNKLSIILQPIFDSFKKSLEQTIELRTQEITIQILALNTKISTLESLIGNLEKKKPAPRQPKSAEPADTQPKEQLEAAITPPQQAKFDVNKLVWFRRMFRDDESFRTRYTTDTLKTLMDADNTFAAKNPAQKVIAQATFIWNYIKANDQTTSAQIEREFLLAKQEWANANQQPQQTHDTHTPPPEHS